MSQQSSDLFVTSDNDTIALHLTPFQSVKIFGWFNQPSRTLAWSDVKEKTLTWSGLRKLGFTASDLKRLQPDKHAWIQRGGIRLKDLPDLLVFPVNPFVDFRADVGEVWDCKFSAQQLLEMGVTYNHFVQAGLSPLVMQHFQFTLREWLEFGFGEPDVKKLTDAEVHAVFRITKQDLLSITQNFKPLYTSTFKKVP